MRPASTVPAVGAFYCVGSKAPLCGVSPYGLLRRQYKLSLYSSRLLREEPVRLSASTQASPILAQVKTGMSGSIRGLDAAPKGHGGSLKTYSGSMLDNCERSFAYPG